MFLRIIIPTYKGTETILGAGSHGIVISDSVLKEQKMVRKFSKSSTDMDDGRFPLEFCIPYITNSPYIVRVKSNTSKLHYISYSNCFFRYSYIFIFMQTN